MNKKKGLYSSPTTVFYEEQLERNILSGFGKDNAAGKGWGSDPDDDEIIDGGTF